LPPPPPSAWATEPEVEEPEPLPSAQAPQIGPGAASRRRNVITVSDIIIRK
jgi:hypothetical protein